jgi:hypothetical protein
MIVAPRQSSLRRDRQNGHPDCRCFPIQIVALHHQALGLRAPMAVWREDGAGPRAVDMMDNAAALPTCPQPQQQTQPLAA